jgi:hypothetical protein
LTAYQTNIPFNQPLLGQEGWPGTTNIDPNYQWVEGGTDAFNKAFQQSAWVQFETNFNNNKDKMAASGPDIGMLWLVKVHSLNITLLITLNL